MAEVGLLLPTRESMLYGARLGDPRPLVELAVAAEQLGFDAVWVGDSLLARPRPEPFTVLGAVAASTRAVRLGTAVLLPVLREPLLMAQQVATLDLLSGGRLILGVGAAGDNPAVRHEHAAVGADFARRASTMVKVVQRCQALWRGDEGEEVLLPRPAQPGGPPIWVGGGGPRTLERVGRHFDGWFPNAPGPERLAAGLARIREVAEAEGRDPSSIAAAIYLTVTIGEPDAALAAQRAHMEGYYGQPYEVMSRHQACYAGPAEGCSAWLASFIAGGASHLSIRFGSGDPTGQLALFEPCLDELRRRPSAGGLG